MALILNIETATEVCSVALADEKGIIDILENSEGRSHASLLTVLIDDLLKKNGKLVINLDAVAVSMGPGSYTGLRIGVSVAKGLCFGSDKPLIAVSTLQSMAQGFVEQKLSIQIEKYKEVWLCPMIDAKRMEVYLAFFDIYGKMQIETRAVILTGKSFEELLAERTIFFFGSGASKFSDLLEHPNAKFLTGYQNSAKDMIHLSQNLFENNEFQDVAYFEPFYLKDFLTTVPKDKVLRQFRTTDDKL